MGKTHRAPDKWSKEAKKRGFRARSAFKLIQINKEYPFLGESHVLVDLCAAPGGWCQVAAEAMPLQSTIIGVDLVPIKPIRGVVTFQEDITTKKCINTLKKELNGKEVDVVLHDGAPNVGQNWTHDAFTQSNLVLSSLKLATELLRRGGIFVTKVFRSTDYTALLYLFGKLFKNVNAIHPEASRQQSAEIFVVCRNYCGAKGIDPKFFEINEVFKQVDINGPEKVPSLLHNKTTGKERHRNGYDESLGQTLFRSVSINDFITSEDPAQVLSTTNQLVFDDEKSEKYKKYPETTDDIIENCKDLKVLSKTDLKALLKWRKKMIMYEHPDIHKKNEEKKKSEKEKKELDVNNPEQLSQYIKEITEKDDKQKKKEKRREEHRIKQQKLKLIRSMEKTAVDMDTYNDETIFQLKDLKNDEMMDDIVKGEGMPEDGEEKDYEIGDDKEEEEEEENSEDDDEEDEEGDEYSHEINLEEQAEEMYRKYKAKKDEREKNIEENGIETNKKGLKLRKVQEQALLDKIVKERVEGNENEYYKMLIKSENMSDEESEETDDDEIDTTNSLVKKFEDKPLTKTDVFFSNPIFKDVLNKENIEAVKRKLPPEFDILQTIDDDAEEICKSQNKKILTENNFQIKPEVIEELDKIPKTEKQIRHEKRLKQLEKQNKKKKPDYEEIPLEDMVDDNLTEEQKKRRNLIKSGMGNVLLSKQSKSNDFEVVPLEESHNKNNTNDSDEEDDDDDDMSMEEEENEELDSDDEDYDYFKKKLQNNNNEEENEEDEERKKLDYDPEVGTDEHIQALSIGGMMRKKSDAIDFIDACYNRYAFNDENLPSWFAEDEKKYNRPQIPITKDVYDQIKKKYEDLANAPIGKVAEARARKANRLRRLKDKAKAKLDSVVGNEDLPGVNKIKEFHKIAKAAEAIKKKGKVYIVGKKSGITGQKLGSKYKVVDRRMKRDKVMSKMRERGVKKSRGSKTRHKKRR